jgi:hypothetical protein
MPPDTLIEWMLSLEQSGLGRSARSAVWLYPSANLLHVLGAALLLGSIATFDVAVLRRMAVATALAGVAIPIAALGLGLQFVSGAVLLSAEASALVRNPAFQLKMAMLLIGLVNVAVFHALFGRGRMRGGGVERARPFAALSLAVWTAVLLAGRAIAYL